MDADTEKKEYEFHWGGNAEYYAEQGCYDWIASHLDKQRPKKVFDVGCGTGEGLSVLRRRFGCQILSVDENAYCLRKTANRLRSEGAKVQVDVRYRYIDLPRGKHGIQIQPGSISLAREVMLLQGDLLLLDTELVRFIESKAPFDAVTIWLIGTYQGRASCVNLANLAISDPGTYRRYVNSAAYELAPRILRSGGVIQVVERGEVSDDPAIKREWLDIHQEIASKNNLQTFSVEERPYNELTGGRGVRMTSTLGTSGRNPSSFVSGMISVLSRKP